MSITACPICVKHQTLPEHTGDVIEERGGLTLTHFPFLKDEPATKGRLVVEPKRHVEDFSDLSEEEAAALGLLIKSGIMRLTIGLHAEHVYVFRINDKVAHLHFHLVPRFPGVPKDFRGLKILDWPQAERVTLTEIKRITQILKGVL